MQPDQITTVPGIVAGLVIAAVAWISWLAMLSIERKRRDK